MKKFWEKSIKVNFRFLALKKEPDAKHCVKLQSPAINGPRAIKVALTARLLVSQNLLVKR